MMRKGEYDTFKKEIDMLPLGATGLLEHLVCEAW